MAHTPARPTGALQPRPAARTPACPVRIAAHTAHTQARPAQGRALDRRASDDGMGRNRWPAPERRSRCRGRCAWSWSDSLPKATHRAALPRDRRSCTSPGAQPGLAADARLTRRVVSPDLRFGVSPVGRPGVPIGRRGPETHQPNAQPRAGDGRGAGSMTIESKSRAGGPSLNWVYRRETRQNRENRRKRQALARLPNLPMRLRMPRIGHNHPLTAGRPLIAGIDGDAR